MPHTNLPASTVSALAVAPIDRPVVLLMRHAARPHGRPEDAADSVLLTGEGRQQSRALGETLGKRLVGLRTSSVPRCIETAALVSAGAARPVPIRMDHRLGRPGVLVSDAEQAWQSFRDHSYCDLMTRLLDGGQPPPGFEDPREAIEALLRGLVEDCATPGVHVCVSHDCIVGIAVGLMLGWQSTERWPAFMEGAALWVAGGRLRVHWDGDTRLAEVRQAA